MLAVGTAVTAVFAGLQMGLAALGPRLAEDFELSLTGVGLALSAVSIGMTATLLPWGMAIDRLGEARTVAAGLVGCAAALMVPVVVGGFPVLLASLLAAGMSGSAAVMGGSRSVVEWFAREDRGFALGVRQAAIPTGTAAASLALPWIAHHAGVRGALAVLSVACLCGAVCALAVLHPPGTAAGARPQRERPRPAGGVPWRDRRLWILAAGVSGLQATQGAMIAFLVTLLHHRGLSVEGAAALAGVAQLLTAGARILFGRRSDRPGARIPLLRRLALATTVLMGISALLLAGPVEAFAPVLIAAAVASASWNGVAFAAAADFAAPQHLASTLNLLATVLTCIAAAAPLAFAVVIDQLSWTVGLTCAAAGPVLAAAALYALDGRDGEYRGSDAERAARA